MVSLSCSLQKGSDFLQVLEEAEAPKHELLVVGSCLGCECAFVSFDRFINLRMSSVKREVCEVFFFLVYCFDRQSLE
jgi:hypothetical protein